jgi:hypothetical protein
VPAPQRRLLACLAALAAVALALQAAGGGTELTLTFAPFALIAALVLSGRFVGERHAVARIRAARVTAPRRAPAAVPRPAPAIALVSALTRSVRAERGPPAAPAPAA